MRWAECCPRAGEEIKNGAFWRDLFAELFGMYLLMIVYFILPANYSGESYITTHALGAGFAVISIGWCMGDFSGGHMNPAVTMTLLLRLKITFLRAFLYWIVQCGGAIAAAYTVKNIIGDAVAATTRLNETTFPDTLDPWKAIVLELIFTTILCMVVHGATNIKRKGELYMNTIPIGCAYALGIFMGGRITGGSMNPARSLGPVVAMMEEDGIWDNHWVYWAGPMGGAVVAAVVYTILNMVHHPNKDTNAAIPVTNTLPAKSDIWNSQSAAQVVSNGRNGATLYPVGAMN